MAKKKQKLESYDLPRKPIPTGEVLEPILPPEKTDPLAAAREAAIKALSTLKWTEYIPHEPTAKQLAFLSLPHREAFFGGAAGGGIERRMFFGAYAATRKIRRIANGRSPVR